jgi:hypothetical protein
MWTEGHTYSERFTFCVLLKRFNKYAFCSEQEEDIENPFRIWKHNWPESRRRLQQISESGRADWGVGNDRLDAEIMGLNPT